MGILLMRDRQLRAPAGVSADLTCRLPAAAFNSSSLNSGPSARQTQVPAEALWDSSGRNHDVGRGRPQFPRQLVSQ